MDARTIAAIIGSLVTMLGAAATMVTKVNKQYEMATVAEAQVSSLGKYYSYARKTPLRVMWWALLTFSLVGLVMLLQGVAESVPLPSLQLFPTLLRYWPIPAAATAVVVVCSYFELPSRVILFFGARSDKTQFDPGYINTRWQLDDPSKLQAMNYDASSCSIVGVAIWELMITETSRPGEQAPDAAGVPSQEKANYIFFACVIEHWVHRLITDKSKLNEMWKYMAAAASSAQRPFLPANVTAHKANYFQFLKDIDHDNKGELPIRQEINDAVIFAADWLAAQYRGDASRLAISTFNSESPRAVLSHLDDVEPFTGNDSMKHLFLKLSTRMRVWSGMDPGPFLYPFNSGIALLLLNSGCILVSQDKKSIELEANEGFRALFAAAEEKVVRAAFNHLKNNLDNPEMRAFTANVFGCAPEEINEWIFFDYVDLWLFTHTRHQCRVRTQQQPATPCLLKPGDANCFCVRPTVEWRPGKNSIFRP
jgi:hypothetical protein